MHRGYIVITYYGGEDDFVGNIVYYKLMFEYKRQGNRYTFDRSQQKLLSSTRMMTEITRFNDFYSIEF